MINKEQLKDVSVQGENGQVVFFKVRDELGNVSETVSDRIVIREAFGENTYGIMKEDFNNTGILLDIGANIGAVSLFCVALGAKRVLAYEPEPDNFSMLKMNLEMNRALNVEAINLGIWKDERILELVASQGASTSNEEAVKLHKDSCVNIRTVSLREALKGIEEIDVLKCDCEGGEYELFFDEEINKKARKIVIEYHTTTIDKFGALLATLSLTHNVQAYGNYQKGGGQIIALRY